jgi:oxygen-dependent protoporphyrinogen oxidase
VKAAIVGAGISGLATAQAILAREPNADITLFEAAARVGGKVETEITPEGYLCEWGVNAFLDKSPRTLELCSEVGLSPLRGDARVPGLGTAQPDRPPARARRGVHRPR